ncbi:CAAX protease self-immunity [Quadrisphaera sp. DSM 44207]|nr:CAAX protease self-immunity [Quadrisphaera sp. DSM 44207]
MIPLTAGLVQVGWRRGFSAFRPRTRLQKLQVGQCLPRPVRSTAADVFLAAAVSMLSIAVVTAYLKHENVVSLGPPQLYLPYVIVGSALVNSVTEEMVWRSAALTILTRATPRWAAVSVSASSFGIAHYALGLPSGGVGVALASAFGAPQGFLFLRTGSVVLPVLVHFVVDVAILLSIGS